MLINPDILVTDAASIKSIGIKNFSENFFWPVHEDEYHEFSRKLSNKYINLITNKKSVIFDVALVEMSFISRLQQILHYNYVKNYSIQNNLKLKSGNDSKEYINPDWRLVSLYYSNLRHPYGKFHRKLRRIVKNVLFNSGSGYLGAIFTIFSNNKIISMGTNDDIKSNYIEKNKITCDYLDWPDLLDAKKNNEFDIKEDLENILTSIVIPFMDFLKKDDSFFTQGINFNELENSWIRRFKDALLIYKSVAINAEVEKALFTQCAKPINKLIILSLQAKGVDVISFHHGNDFAFCTHNIGHTTTVSHCNKFIVPTNGIMKLYRRIYSSLPIEKITKVKYESINSSYLNDEYLKNCILFANKDLKHPRKIMIMGYPANTSRYSDEHGLFFAMQIDLEYRLIVFLKSFGYEIIYKVHPDRVNEIEGIFDALVDKYIVEKFESSWKLADLVIFTYTSTTTFGYAMVTPLPIVLIDIDGSPRDHELVNLADLRIERVNANIDSVNRIIFAQEDLIDAINSCDYQVDNQFVEEIFGV